MVDRLARGLLGGAVADRAVGHADLGQRARSAVVGDVALARRSASIFARPKSRTLAWPAGVTMTFVGLMSRWTMPAAWATASASAIWMAMESAASVSRGRPSEQLLEGLALDELHHDVGEPVLLAHVVDRADVGVLQGRAQAGLALEAAAGGLALGQLGAQRLDDHGPVEPQVLGAVGGGLAALAELPDDPVVRERPAWLQGDHRVRRSVRDATPTSSPVK